MDLNEFTQTLIKSSENYNGNKYVPWWNEDADGMYRYHLFKDEEIAEATSLVAAASAEAITAPMGKYKHTLLHLLVWHNFYEAVRSAVERKINVDVTDEDGKGVTPLMLACARSNLEMVKLLIGAGADVMRADASGRTCWHYLVGARPLLEIDHHCREATSDQLEPIAAMLGDNFDAADAEGKTPLITVIERNDNETSCRLTGLLIKKGARTDYRNEKGETLLTLAIKNNHNTAAMALAEVKSLVNEPGRDGETPLKAAEDFRKDAVCMKLKECGAQGQSMYDKRMDLGELERITSNAFAFSEGTDNLAPALFLAQKLINTIDEDDDDEVGYVADILHNALCSDENCTVLDMIAKAGISFTAKYGSRGRMWCFRDKCFSMRAGIKAIKKLISLGVDINSAVIDGVTPVHIVAQQSRPYSFRNEKITYFEEAAELFDPESATVLDNSGVSAMHTAARYGHADMLSVLVKNGADINVTQDAPAKAGNTPLHCACERYKADVVKTLIELGADDSLKNVDGETAAHIICKKITFGFSSSDRDRAERNRPIILAMLKTLDEPRNDGMTPLMLMQSDYYSFRKEALPILLNGGADVNRRDNYGRTPLIVAMDESGDKEMVKELLLAGADINAVDKSGRSALHSVLMQGGEDIARYLVKKGADYNRADNKGNTAAMIAAEKGCDDVLELMTDIK